MENDITNQKKMVENKAKEKRRKKAIRQLNDLMNEALSSL